jgi:putative two-component system response regulator
MTTPLPERPRTTILLVDDEPTILSSINETLRHDYRTRVATDGQRAIELAFADPPPDLVVLDVEMPAPDGYEVCRVLKNNPRTRDIPIIFLSAHSDVSDVTRGLELGAVDYVSKPVLMPILAVRIRTQLRLKDAKTQLLVQNHQLERLVAERTLALQKRTDEVLRVQEMTIVALGSLAETRDNETGNHIHRTQGYVKALTDKLLLLPRYREAHESDYFSAIWKSAPLHDIGKVGIPDSILLKPGPLTRDEFEIMKQHTLLGRKALDIAGRMTNGERNFLTVATQIAYSHHEKWDGRGYPEGLSGTQIPLPARLMAIADVYDALVSKRVYKDPIEHSTATGIIRDERGRHFDPDIVDCFLDHADEFQAIADAHADA